MDVSALPKSEPTSRGTRLPRRFVRVLIGIGVVTALIMSYAPTARWLTRNRGEHLTLTEAKDRARVALPDTATDIRLYQHLHPGRVVVVDFAITENDFLEWAARQGWKPERIVGSITIWPRSGFGDRVTVVSVTDGLSYDTITRGRPNTFSVTYDRGTQRAYYQFSSEPHGDG